MGGRNKLEKIVETEFVRRVTALGLLAPKLNTGHRGWPDRMVLIPGGVCLFIELKRAGGEARPLQEHVHDQIRSLGHGVVVADSWRGALEFVLKCLPNADDYQCTECEEWIDQIIVCSECQSSFCFDCQDGHSCNE